MILSSGIQIDALLAWRLVGYLFFLSEGIPMSKHNSCLDQVLLNLAGLGLTSNEYQVVLAILIDAPNFYASQRLVAKRTGIQQTHVNRTLKSLREKAVLEISSEGSRSHPTGYEIHPRLRVKGDTSLGLTPPGGDTTVGLRVRPAQASQVRPVQASIHNKTSEDIREIPTVIPNNSLANEARDRINALAHARALAFSPTLRRLANKGTSL